MSDVEDVPVGENPNDVVGPVMPEFDYSKLIEDAAPASYGLESITLHHSFKNVRGRTIHIDCSKRTHLGGVNGAGKTSILALIPAFYGEEPERIVAKSSGRLSFLDYYLPSLQSLIIFEYQRHDGYCCSVMYRHPSGKLSYLFVQGKAGETFFGPDMAGLIESGANSADVFQRLRDLGVEVSKSIDTITDYRAVIQRNRRLLSRRPARARFLRDLSASFGMGGPDTKMIHIDRLTHVVLNHDRLLSSFKTMICETQFTDHHVNSRPKPVDRDGLVENIRSLVAFGNEEDGIRKCIQKEDERRSVVGVARVSAANLAVTLGASRKTLQEHRDSANEAGNEIEALNDQFTDDNRTIINDLTRANGTLQLTTDKLDDLYGQKLAYEAEKLPEKALELKNLPERQKTLADAQADLKSMTSQAVQAEEEYARDIQNLKHAFRNEQESKNTAIRDEKDALDKARYLHEARLKDVGFESLKEQSAITQARGIERSVIAERLTEAKTLHTTMGETLEETERLAMVQAALVEAEDVYQQADLLLHAAQTTEVQARKDQESAQTGVTQTEKVLAQSRSEEDAVKRQLFPVEGTWISLLRKAGPEWADGIAKVVDFDLLQRDDLNPQQLPGHHDDFDVMGWRLSLEHIPVPGFAASDDELRQKLESLAQRIGQEIELVRHAESAAEAANKALNLRRQEAAKRKTELAMARSALENERRHLNVARQDVETAKRERKVGLAKRVNELERQCEQFDAQTQTLVQGCVSRASEHTVQIKGLWSDEEERLQAAIANAVELANTAKRRHKERLKSREEVYSQKLDVEGINPELVRSQRKKRDDAEQAVTAIRKSEERVREYQQWLRSDWAHVEVHTGKAAELSKQVTGLTEKQSALKVAFERELTTKRTRLSDAKRDVGKLKTSIETAESALKQYPGDDYQDAGGLPGDLAALTQDLQAHCEKMHRLRGEVLTAFTKARAVLNGFHGTLIQESWSKLTNARRQTIGDVRDEYDDTFKLDQVSDLSSLMDIDIPQAQAVVVQWFISEAGKLRDYFGSLASLASKVRNVSNTLHQKINMNQKIASITDIKVELRARIEDDASWRPLKTFVRFWEAWQSVNPNKMPDDALVRSFADVTNTLKSASVGESLESMIDMTLSMRENGALVQIRSDNDFRQVSSKGLSYLAIMAVFMGVTRYLCPDHTARITWPVDEIGTLDPTNIGLLADMFEENNITMISACPELSRPLRKFFEHRVFLRKGQIARFVSGGREAISSERFNSLANLPQEMTTEDHSHGR